MEWRKRKELQEEDKFEDLTGEAETLQEQALEKVGWLDLCVGHTESPEVNRRSLCSCENRSSPTWAA